MSVQINTNDYYNISLVCDLYRIRTRRNRIDIYLYLHFKLILMTRAVERCGATTIRFFTDDTFPLLHFLIKVVIAWFTILQGRQDGALPRLLSQDPKIQIVHIFRILII